MPLAGAMLSPDPTPTPFRTVTTPAPSAVQVVLLCAAWCGVCREFAPAFEALQPHHPGVHFHWVDVEDQANLVDDLDVENFPTLLLGVNGQPVFFGTILPHASTLARLVQDASSLPALSHEPRLAVLREVLASLAAHAR